MIGKAWRYWRGNQKAQVVEAQAIQRPKEKKDNDLQNVTMKSKD